MTWAAPRRRSPSGSRGTCSGAGGYCGGFLILFLLFRLYGYKWFSSATDSDMSMSLARVGGGDKLSMFYLKTRDETGRLNNIQVTLGSRIDYLSLT